MMRTAMAWLALAVLMLPLATAAMVTTAGRNCSPACDYIDIPYPFGIGPLCSLPGFNLTCVVGTGKDDASYLLLGNPRIQVDSFYFYQSLTVGISHSLKMIRGVRDYSIHWESPGRAFAISGSSNMSLVVFGCGVKASLFIPDRGAEIGSCSVGCVDVQIMESLPPGPCLGIGCCVIPIQVNLRAFTLNISRSSEFHPQHRNWNQVTAFVTGPDYSRWLRPGDVPYLFGYGVSGVSLTAELDWAIPYKPNCKSALEDRSSYACISNNSKCEDSPIGGYLCSCLWGYGNPYVLDGCQDQALESPPPVYEFIQPETDCPTWCGNVSIPFPFGTKIGCFAKLHLYLACLPGTTTSIPQLTDRTVVTGVSLDDGVLQVREVSEPNGFLASSDPPLYTLSGESGVVKWAIDYGTCEQAKRNESDYRCFSSHSDCLDVTDDRTHKHVGYRCKCAVGFEGNPYLKDGCTDTNECMQPDKYICRGICQNSFGSYTCTSCPRGTDFSGTTRKCKPSTVILGVTIGLSSGGGILVLAAFVVILTRRWKRGVQKRLRKRYFRKNKGILLEQLISSDQNASDGTKIFSLEELEKATNNFDHARVVGHGGHGTVYKGILTDQRVVAIKRSKLEASTEIEQFINEVSILSMINHRNVVKLYGCCLEAEVPLLVYEFVPNGTLYNLLHCEQNGNLLPLSWEERMRIATEIASALTYLHSAASMSILHRDVKCMNVLLNDSYTVKVSDFGASRSIPIDQTHLVTAVQGTFGYLDPEYYHTGQLNEKSDVYSFGVILVELLTRKKPIIQNEHSEKQNLSNYFLWAMKERPLEEILDGHILEEAGEEAILCVAGLAAECLSLTRGARPTMKDVELRLQMLSGRHMALEAKRGNAVSRPRYEAAQGGGHAGVIVVAGHHGSRQYSLEQECVSSFFVPR